MDPLATIADLEDRYGDIPTDDYAQAQSALVDASATVRTFTGQTLSPATSTHTVKVKNGYAVLPQRPVLTVSSVTAVGNAVGYTVSGDRLNVASQVPNVFSWEPYRSGLTEVTVTYEHGFDPMDETITSIVCQLALRSLTADVEDSTITDEKLGSYSVGRGAIGAAGPSGLFSSEKELLRHFTRPLGNMRLYGA